MTWFDGPLLFIKVMSLSLKLLKHRIPIIVSRKSCSAGCFVKSHCLFVQMHIIILSQLHCLYCDKDRSMERCPLRLKQTVPAFCKFAVLIAFEVSTKHAARFTICLQSCMRFNLAQIYYTEVNKNELHCTEARFLFKQQTVYHCSITEIKVFPYLFKSSA